MKVNVQVNILGDKKYCNTDHCRFSLDFSEGSVRRYCILFDKILDFDDNGKVLKCKRCLRACKKTKG